MRNFLTVDFDDAIVPIAIAAQWPVGRLSQRLRYVSTARTRRLSSAAAVIPSFAKTFRMCASTVFGLSQRAPQMP
jgi:hypothetical protein